MKIRKKIEHWLKDKGFREYANKRLLEEFNNTKYHTLDALYEDLVEHFDSDDRYIVPMVDYLFCRLHTAQLCKSSRQRERELWWIWCQIMFEGRYVDIFIDHYEPLLKALGNEIMPILHREYVKLNRKKE